MKSKQKSVHKATKKKVAGTAHKVSKQPKKSKKPAGSKVSLHKSNVAHSWIYKLGVFFGAGRFERLYMYGALACLFVSTTVWTLLGVRLESGNADQLVNAYLFEHLSTLREAVMPGQHTFLIKWPLFFLVKVMGFSPFAFAAVTLCTVLATVALFVWILYRIERRPLLFGTICLALASVLLLVPAQPYPGGLLPVNMAMLTTRNIEYILYIVALGMFARMPRIKSAGFWLAVGIMGVLIASDKLFLTLGVGAAGLALLIYTLLHKKTLARVAAVWLVGELLAGVVAALLLRAINATHLTYIAGQSSAGPYGLIHTAHQFLLGSVYAILGLVSNVGISMGLDSRILRDVPHQIMSAVISWGFLTIAVNLAVAAAGIYASIRLARMSLARDKPKTPTLDTPMRLSIMMILTTVVAVAIFIMSDHYYPVDARYLGISVFTLFVCIATISRTLRIPSKKIVLAGGVIFVAVLLGIPAMLHAYTKENAALGDINKRNALVAKVLTQHKVSVLVGDYWRVIPSRIASKNTLQVMPLASCTQPRQDLSSQTWQPDLHSRRFAYLLSFDKSLTNYSHCTLRQVLDTYGHPNANALIAGTASNPTELLLFYDHGLSTRQPKKPQTSLVVPRTVPVDFNQLPDVKCLTASSLNIVAHQDDDLLFMNPDIMHELKMGHCVRTVYLTAGDGGSDTAYWLSRQRGSEAAYASMLGVQDVWLQRVVELTDGQHIIVLSPRDSSRVSLIFMKLPDGNLRGQGFASSGQESLARLESGQIGTIHSVDGRSSYTFPQLISTLSALINTYRPTLIRTQSTFLGSAYPDHSDHMAVSRITVKAYRQYASAKNAQRASIPILHYIGYPIHDMQKNVGAEDLTTKTEVFNAYVQFDGAVCGAALPDRCQISSTYGAYLARQYKTNR